MQMEQAPALAAPRPAAHSKQGALFDRVCRTSADAEAAQRLRYRFFVEEVGATSPNSANGLAMAILWSDIARLCERAAPPISQEALALAWLTAV